MIILFGLAGSGKSTQGQLLAKKHQMTWLSVGQVLRNDGRFSDILKRGDLVNDDQVIELMNDHILKELQKGCEIILDGFPRDAYQAKWFAEHLADQTTGAVFLDVPKEELYRRMKERGRADDTKEVIERRFKIVEDNIREILNILQQKNVKISQISGVGSIEEVTSRLETVFNLH